MHSGFNKVRRFLLTVLVVGGALALFAGCSSSDDPTLPIGSWDDGFGNVYTITGTTITYAGEFEGSEYGYSGVIVYIDDSRFNGGDTSITPDSDAAVNPGHVAFKYTAVSDPSWGEVGKYNIFRWADGTNEDEKVMTQGGKYEGTFGEDDFRMVVFDSNAEARNGATNEAGFFPYAAPVTRQ